MTKPIQTIMLAVLAIMITSCATYRKDRESDRESARPVNLSLIKIGMTRTEVQTALNKKPDNVVAAKRYPQTNTLVEVVQYTQWGSTQSWRSTQLGQTNIGTANVGTTNVGTANVGTANVGNTNVVNTTQTAWMPMQRYWLYFVNDKLDKWEIAVPDRSPRI